MELRYRSYCKFTWTNVLKCSELNQCPWKLQMYGNWNLEVVVETTSTVRVGRATTYGCKEKRSVINWKKLVTRNIEVTGVNGINKESSVTLKGMGNGINKESSSLQNVLERLCIYSEVE